MKASLFILCTILTVLQAEKYYRRKNSNYQTGKLDEDNHETMISSNANLKPELIEDDVETNLKPKITGVYRPGRKNTPKKSRSIPIKLDGAAVGKRRTKTPSTAKKVSGVKRLSEVNRKNKRQEDEIILAKKVSEISDAKLANVSKEDDENGSGKLDAAVQEVKGSDGVNFGDGEDDGYQNVNYEDNVIEGDGAIEFIGNNRLGKRSLNINDPNTRYNKKSTNKNKWHAEDADEGEDDGYQNVNYEDNVIEGDGVIELIGNNRLGKRSLNIINPNTRYNKKSTNKNKWHAEDADDGEDGGYRNFNFKGNVIEGYGVIESIGNKRLGRRSRNINNPNTRYNKKSNKKNMWHGEDDDEGKKVYAKPWHGRSGGYVRPKRWTW